MQNVDFDVIIVGGGPAGLACARSLVGAGLRTVVVESSTDDDLSTPPYDGRDIALTHGSKRILTDIGVWERLPADEIYPIRDARVLDGHSPYALEFTRREAGVDALGFLVSNHLIRRTLYEEVSMWEEVLMRTARTVDSVNPDSDAVSVTLDNGESLKASLLIAADSRFSGVRRQVGIPARTRDFGRTALVCRMNHQLDNGGVASECFQYGQTVAALPLSRNISSIVITVPTDRADELANMALADFEAWVTSRLEAGFGQMKLLSKRFVYPLIAVLADRFVGTRTALIGDAAVGMHPVTAHGYNLGLSGQELLTEIVRTTFRQGNDIGAASRLERFNRRHRRVVLPVYCGTNALVGLYTSEKPPTKMLRKALLRAANHLRPMRKVVIDRLVGH